MALEEIKDMLLSGSLNNEKRLNLVETGPKISTSELFLRKQTQFSPSGNHQVHSDVFFPLTQKNVVVKITNDTFLTPVCSESMSLSQLFLRQTTLSAALSHSGSDSAQLPVLLPAWY